MRLHHHTTCVRLMSPWNPELMQVWQVLEIHQVPELSNKFRSVVFLATLPLLYMFILIRSTYFGHPMWQEGTLILMACLATKVPNGRISSANVIVICSPTHSNPSL